MSPTFFEVVIPANEVMGCFEIDFIDDKIGLQSDEVFDIAVTIIEPSDAGDLIAPEASLTIIDNDSKQEA